MGFHQPAEWAPHEGCWLAWPSHADLWLELLPDVQAEFTALCRAIAEGGEKLEILVPSSTLGQDTLKAARRALEGLPVRFHDIPFGDIWLRDIAPIYLKSEAGERAVASFRFNGWGEKYILDYDADVSLKIAKASGLKILEHSWILEGGSIEVDGEGTCLTTRQCLLNPNRNAGMTQEQIETKLKAALGVQKILWLGDGLLNDHTDGHIDTIARYIAPGVVMCMEARTPNDPNRAVLNQIARDLSQMTDARGRKLKVVRVPSPGLVLEDETDPSSRVMPASSVNFYIANRSVIVPTYGANAGEDAAAVAAIAREFPDRKTVGLPARATLAGGGSFHCITQQIPQGAPR